MTTVQGLAAAGLTLLLLGVAVAGAADPPVPAHAPARSDKNDKIGKIEKTEAEWRAALTPEAYRVLREKGTERAFSGDLLESETKGVYTCGGCGLPLFSSEHKFDSGTGWPSFWQPVAADAIATEADGMLGMARTEVLCARCGGHLGHVFPDGPKPTGLRYCINSVSLDLVAGPAKSEASSD